MNRLGYSVSIAFMFLTAALSSIAATPASKYPFDNITWQPSLKEKPSVGLRMGDFYAEFERTTLDEIRQAVGAGEIAHQGDAGDSMYWLCYTNFDSKHSERIWVTSHGEMGGPDHMIDGVHAELLGKGQEARDCPELPSRLKPVSLDHGLWLNTQKKVVHTALGVPSYKKGSWESFDYKGKVPAGDLCQPNGFDQISGLVIRFEEGRATSLYMAQTTSC